MKRIKDHRISLLSRTTFYHRQRLMHLRAMAAFDFGGPDALLPEAEAWMELDKALGARQTDIGFCKERGEFLVAGACYVPGGTPAPACPVSVRVGPVEKRLNVFGDRYFTALGVKGPEPFAVMPLTWVNAFGGPSDPRNLRGKGMDLVENRLGERIRPMPNVEYPGALMASPSDAPPPACFLPRRPPCLVDYRTCGTFNERWRVETWPFAPDDFDLDNLNQATPDQWLNGYFLGGEEIEIRNMHPSEPLLRSRLPRLRARLIVRRRAMGRLIVSDIPANLDTVWLFPDSKRGLCVWRGFTSVMDERCSDIAAVLAFVEPMDEPQRPLSFYDPEYASEIPPTAYLSAPPAYAAPKTSETPRAEPASLTATGGQTAAGTAPRPAGSAGTCDSAALETAEAALCQVIRIMERQLHELGLLPGEPAPAPAPDALGLSCQSLLDALDKTDGLHPGQTEAMRDALARLLADFEVERQRHAPVQPEPPQPPEPDSPPAAPDSALTRDAVLSRHAAGEDLTGLDLTGLDLSRANLAGARLSGAVLAAANLSRADLSGANLTGADLTGARAESVNAAGADLSGAMAGGLFAPCADFTGANLAQTDLCEAHCDGAVFAQAVLSRTVFTQASLAGCRFDGCAGEKADFTGARAAGASFVKAALSGADFSGAGLEKASFQEAHAPSIGLHQAKAMGASFKNADLRGAKCAGDGDFRQADFTGARLEEAVIMKSQAADAILAHACLDGAILTQCLLMRAVLNGASAKKACLDGADLDGAGLREVNFFKASLRRAKLYNCDLRDANCFSVDFYQAAMRSARLEGANLKRTILAGWSPERI